MNICRRILKCLDWRRAGRYQRALWDRSMRQFIQLENELVDFHAAATGRDRIRALNKIHHLRQIRILMGPRP